MLGLDQLGGRNHGKTNGIFSRTDHHEHPAQIDRFSRKESIDSNAHISIILGDINGCLSQFQPIFP